MPNSSYSTKILTDELEKQLHIRSIEASIKGLDREILELSTSFDSLQGKSKKLGSLRYKQGLLKKELQEQKELHPEYFI